MWEPYRPQYGPAWSCIVPHMDTLTHDQWMHRYGVLSSKLADVHARRDELVKYSEHIPGPVLQKRGRELDRLELDLLDELAALVELSNSGAVS